MYAVIETGGQQFKVSPGDIIKVGKIEASGQEVILDKVLMISRDENISLGNPFLKNASVKAEIQGTGKSEKVIVYKQRPRKGYRKLRGHRQDYSILVVKDIVFGG